MSHGRPCKLQKLTAALSTEFGIELFRKKAGKHADRILAEMGVYSHGKQKGQQKGFLHWIKVVEGGFDYSDQRRGVLRGGSIEYRVAKEYGTEHENCEIWLDFEERKAGLIKLLPEAEKHAEEICNQVTSVEKQLEQLLQRSPEEIEALEETYKAALEVLERQLTTAKDTVSQIKSEIDLL
ncbi:hypothetical protein [Neptuniibacter sp. QD37_11]|uniref:hypothetical protein n=1 Tax=Neptuniibacter sp. QD37_11 TaxID=3398209 RepID=UPI0039F6219E